MIHRLRVRNFKNLREATLGLGGLTLLVGTNASGKSNLRDAFRFVNGMGRGYTLADTLGAKYVEGGSLQWTGIRGGTREVLFPGAASFTLETIFSNDDKVSREINGLRFGDLFRHAIEVEIDRKSGLPRVVRESLYSINMMEFGEEWRRPWRIGPRSFESFASEQAIYDSEPADMVAKRNRPRSLGVSVPHLSKGKQSSKQLTFSSDQPILSQIVLRDKIPPFVRRAVTRALEELQSMQFLDLDPDAMRKPSGPGQNILGDRGENLSSVLQAICADETQKAAILKWIIELTPLDVADFEFVPDQTGRILLSLVESGGHSISAYSASDGTLRFLAMIAALFGPRPAGLYFFEELDNGIHPARLYLLLQLIEQTVAEGRIQMVATTHSPQLLGFLSEQARAAATLVYRLHGHPEGRTKRILDIPDIKRVLEGRSLGRLHELGWFENAVAFLQNGESET